MNKDKVRVEALQVTPFNPKDFVHVYVSSKVHHAGFLLNLRHNWPRIHWTARWPVMALTLTQEQKAAIPASHWLQDNENDIISSDVVLGYAEEVDKMKGGIWELGIATAHRKKIYLVGNHPDWSHWKHHPAVASYGKSLEETLQTISKLKHYVTE